MQTFLVDNSVRGTLWGDGPLVLVAHGGGQHRSAPAVTGRAAMLVEAGFRVAALDAPGHGERRGGPGSPVPGPPERVAERNAEVAARAVPEWRAAIDLLAPDGPVGFWGVSLGGATGLALMAAEPRITAGAVGLATIDDERARTIVAPIEFTLQWDDEFIPREAGLATYDALGSEEKSLHVNPGGHTGLPRFEAASAIRFFQRHLHPAAAPVAGYRS
ncbi:alpha/beta fold hydrolase [Actinoplanes sp. LDG1-06]|uniref:Alpha/beta fold hydrolase n=1 Tax=Paractinoplanes ovalisporus TaxID=2810368 RepID=A0ABS2A5E3_9ACTN|nr:alpha/beta fold hydrolase [Actinoplanes ovalisporus]MBM2614466.1 alpha/beta fold hydrolase [Actinoplanes ovalisporus]